MAMLPLIIGAGLGLAQGIESDVQEQAAKPTKATTEEWSPFTHASIDQAQASLHPAQFVGDIGQGAAAGARYAQGGYGSGAPNINTGVQNFDAGGQAAQVMKQSMFGGANPYSQPAATNQPVSPYSLGAPNGAQPNTFSWPSPYYNGQPSLANPYAAGGSQ